MKAEHSPVPIEKPKSSSRTQGGKVDTNNGWFRTPPRVRPAKAEPMTSPPVPLRFPVASGENETLWTDEEAAQFLFAEQRRLTTGGTGEYTRSVIWSSV